MTIEKKLSLSIIIILVLSLVLATFALYTKSFIGDNNKVRAARFTVDSKGTLDGDAKFDLTDSPIYPGVELEVYEFQIDKTGTEVPVEYEITVSSHGKLFEPVTEGESPVIVSLLRKIGDDWLEMEGLDNVQVIPTEDLEEFRIDLKWEDSNYDIEYQGKPGTIKIKAVATQTE